tara:strand:+ start:5661 stop:5855 length:195 start_codon:yes stop_codon:yes gene_type:complete
MPETERKDRTQYYKDYYCKTKDHIKYRYYEKKERKSESDKIYEPYGGEKAYYIMKMKEFANISK